MRIAIRFGTGNELTKEFRGESTIAAVLGDPEVKAALGCGENVEGHIGGVPQEGSTLLVDGMTIAVYDRSCTKKGVVLEKSPYLFFYYAPDLVGGEPEHIHVGPPLDGGAAKFWLRPEIKIARAGPYKAHQLIKIRKLIQEHFDTLMRPWM